MAATVFSKQLQKLRKAKGVKQEQLAEHLGVSTQAVSKWENGSYPDGDLLPQIAKFFDVSIDYLYGNEQEAMRIDERIVEYMEKEAGENSKRMDRLLEVQWMAMGNGNFPNGYYPLPKISREEEVAGSGYIGEEGTAFMRLSDDLRYGFIMERPEDGYESYLADTKELAELFALLGDEEAINVLLFMLTLNGNELVCAETVAKYLNITTEKAEYVLEKASMFGNGPTFFSGKGGLIGRSVLLKEGGTEETLYMAQEYVIITILRLFVAAKDILYPIHSYRNLWVNTSETLLDRNKLLKQLKEKGKRGKEENHE